MRRRDSFTLVVSVFALITSSCSSSRIVEITTAENEQQDSSHRYLRSNRMNVAKDSSRRIEQKSAAEQDISMIGDLLSSEAASPPPLNQQQKSQDEDVKQGRNKTKNDDEKNNIIDKTPVLPKRKLEKKKARVHKVRFFSW